MARGAGVVREGDRFRFTLHAPEAAAVELCLFDDSEGPVESRRVSLEPEIGGVWQALVPDVGAGTPYGYRVHGPWEPEAGHRFNAAKLLVDPRARALTGQLRPHPALLASETGSDDRRPSPADSAPFVPRSLVVDETFDWQGVPRPGIPWGRTVIYECHVKGMTRLHTGVPQELRGTYLGLAEPVVTDHLVSLGVTAVELLPVQHFVSEPRLTDHGLSNYFGYNPLAFFAPHEGYATAPGRQVAEFRTMVRELHRAGLEVILDVVFNHTAEGDHRGPNLCLRGIANRLFYRLVPGQRRYYENYSGCGNTLDFGRPETVDLTLECLRFWVEEMGVDGFRFDLAPVLARTDGMFSRDAPILRRIGLDPVLSAVKLIAEPWDLGPGGYQLGGFPGGWSEWNDRFRDAARSYWRGADGRAVDLMQSLTGSPLIFGPGSVEGAAEGRPPRASINMITSHDGFTLADLVSYQNKHNLANGEENRDGHHHNLSRNWGVEGPTDDPEVLALRNRARRNLMATLALSLGVPMISHGDELGRTQHGNNNAYCHDSELTWVDWELGPQEEAWLSYVRALFSLRRTIIVLQSEERPAATELVLLDLDARPLIPGRHPGVEDSALFRPGREDHAFALLWRNRPNWVLSLFNCAHRTSLFRLPAAPLRADRPGAPPVWTRVIGTADPSTGEAESPATFRRSARLEPLSMLVLQARWRPSNPARSHPP